MVEQKKNLVTDKYIFNFGKPIEISVDKLEDEYLIKNNILGIRCNGIYNFSMEFQDIYFDYLSKSNFTESEIEIEKYLKSLGITYEKIESKKSKKVNSKQKGARGERHVSEMLESHFPGLDITRTPGSGAFSTTHNILDSSGKNIMSGDLMASNNNSEEYKRFMKYNWEVKNYESLPDFAGLYYKKSEPLAEWIYQAERDSSNNGKVFVIIFRANRSPDFVIFKEDYANKQSFSERYILRFKFKESEYRVYSLNDVNFV